MDIKEGGWPEEVGKDPRIMNIDIEDLTEVEEYSDSSIVFKVSVVDIQVKSGTKPVKKIWHLREKSAGQCPQIAIYEAENNDIPYYYSEDSCWVSQFQSGLSARLGFMMESSTGLQGAKSIALPTNNPRQSSSWAYSPSQTGHCTKISDWNDLYEGHSSIELSITGSFEKLMCSSPSNSEPIETIRQKSIKLAPGKVMGMFLCKKGYKFKMLNLNSSIDEVVDVFLMAECGAKLPISFSKTERSRSQIMSKKLTAENLVDSLGPQFDAKTQGLVFAIGSVNSKLCYKMTVCGLGRIEGMLTIYGKGKFFQE